jgi:hypothetical protein
MVWSGSRSQADILQYAGLFERASWQILSWNLMIWFAVLIIFLAMLVVIPSVRENTLRRLANLKERDEREEYITGKASRAAYFSTLSLIIFFLFFTLCSISIYEMPKDATHKKHIDMNISMGVNFLEKSTLKTNPEGIVLFATKNIMPSSFSILAILLVWQLFIFNYTARKEQNSGLD